MVKNNKSFTILPLLFIFLFAVATTGFASFEKVFDEAALFTEEERVEINERALSLSEQAELDIIIVTTNDSQGKASRQYALDFYEEHGLGYQGTLDGILYLLNMDEREVYIFTRDKGTDYLPDSKIEGLLDQVYPALSEGNYAESVDIFLNEVESIIAAGPPSGYYAGDSSNSGYTDYTGDSVPASQANFVKQLGIYLLISIAVGGIVVGIMAMGNRGRITVNARTYLEGNSFIVTTERDQHYNTIVTQQKIQRNSNSGGGFSGGSGGGRIGGGGRKF